jgi:uncharacterized protein YjdB
MMHSHILRIARRHCSVGAQCLFVAGALVACGGKDGPTVPVAPPQPQAALQSIAVALSPTSVSIGSQSTARATGSDQFGAPYAISAVMWTSTIPAVASVGADGVVTAKGSGTTIIQATSGSVSGQATLAVGVSGVSIVRVVPATVAMTRGAVQQLIAQVLDIAGNPLSSPVIVWSTSDASRATVSGSGVVTAVAVGSVTVTAACGGKTGTSVITVTASAPPAAIATVTVTPGSAALTVGGTTQFSALARDAAGAALSGKMFNWTSSNTTVALVSASGIVTAQGIGTVVVTATSEGISGTATVSVTSGVSGTVFTTPDTYFIDKTGSFNGVGAYWYQGFTLARQTTLVLRVVGAAAIDAAIVTSAQLPAFTGNQSFTGYAVFDNKFGTSTVTLPAGQYYVAARGQATGTHNYRVELDYDIQLSPERGSTFSFVDVYASGAENVGANGGKVWQQFSIQTGFRYLLDGASINAETFIIPASELANFRNGQTFKYFTDYGGNSDASNPGLWELRLPPGDYVVVFRNTGAVNSAITYSMERWRIN